MEESTVCCCRSGSWARAIGWLQIVGAVVILTAIFTAIFSGSLGNPSSRTLSIAFAVTIVLEVLNFILGIVLLRGIYNRNLTQIHDWMVYVLFSSVGSASTAIALFLLEPTTQVITYCFIGLAVILSTNWFAFWTVNLHKRDLENFDGLTPLIDGGSAC